AAFDQKTLEQHIIQTFRRSQRISDALSGVLIEIQAGCAEGEIEVDDRRIDLERLGDIPANIVGNGRSTDTSARTSKYADATDRSRFGAGIEVGNRLDDLQRIERRDEIFRDAAARQLAIELHVIGTADDDDLCGLVTNIGQLLELVDHGGAVTASLDHQQIGGWMLLVIFHRALNPA